MDLEPVGRGIRDEEIADSAPLVRALSVQRLEMIWRNAEPHINRVDGRPDPRYMEIGIRVLDRLARIYRLDAPVAGEAGPDQVPGSSAELVRGQLRALAARMGGDGGEGG